MKDTWQGLRTSDETGKLILQLTGKLILQLSLWRPARCIFFRHGDSKPQMQ